MACGLLLAEVIIQVLGTVFYDRTPEFVWPLADAILILVPLVFGIRLGLLCLFPFAAAEIVWFCKLRVAGPLFHLVAFAATIVILGIAYKKLTSIPLSRKVIWSAILYELSLLGEEVLYHTLRMLFLQKPLRWEAVSGTFLSLANPIFLIILILLCISGRSSSD